MNIASGMTGLASSCGGKLIEGQFITSLGASRRRRMIILIFDSPDCVRPHSQVSDAIANYTSESTNILRRPLTASASIDANWIRAQHVIRHTLRGRRKTGAASGGAKSIHPRQLSRRGAKKALVVNDVMTADAPGEATAAWRYRD